MIEVIEISIDGASLIQPLYATFMWLVEQGYYLFLPLLLWLLDWRASCWSAGRKKA